MSGGGNVIELAAGMLRPAPALPPLGEVIDFARVQAPDLIDQLVKTLRNTRAPLLRHSLLVGGRVVANESVLVMAWLSRTPQWRRKMAARDIALVRAADIADVLFELWCKRSVELAARVAPPPAPYDFPVDARSPPDRPSAVTPLAVPRPDDQELPCQQRPVPRLATRDNLQAEYDARLTAKHSPTINEDEEWRKGKGISRERVRELRAANSDKRLHLRGRRRRD